MTHARRLHREVVTVLSLRAIRTGTHFRFVKS